MVGDMGKVNDVSTRPTGHRALLADYVNRRVTVITNDGRNIVGIMRGFDQVCNVILEQSLERLFMKDNPVQIVPLGLYIIRGDNIAIVGDVDAEKDDKMEWEKVKVCQFICIYRKPFRYNTLLEVVDGLTCSGLSFFCFYFSRRSLRVC